MEKQEILLKVQMILCEKLGTDSGEAHEGARLIEDIGMDSLDAIELCMEIESAFLIKIPDEKFEEVKTIGELVDLTHDIIYQ